MIFSKLPANSIKHNNHGYTIMELVVVVVIMGVLAGLSVPNYDRMKERNSEKAAYRSLRIIKNAVRSYVVREEVATIPDMADIDEISNTLGLSLYEIDDVDIACVGTDGARTNQCTATHLDGWALRIHEQSTESVYCCNVAPCNTTACPTCLNNGSGGCNNLE